MNKILLSLALSSTLVLGSANLIANESVNDLQSLLSTYRTNSERTSGYTCVHTIAKAETYEGSDYSIRRFVPWNNDEYVALKTEGERYFFKLLEDKTYQELTPKAWYEKLKDRSHNLADFFDNGESPSNDCATGTPKAYEEPTQAVDDFSNRRDEKFRKTRSFACGDVETSDIYKNEFFQIQTFNTKFGSQYLIVMEQTAEEYFFVKKKGEKKYKELRTADWEYQLEMESKNLDSLSQKSLDKDNNCRYL